MIEPMTSLAFSVYSGKGVHALLLGSGISRSSGIPTGWEIVLDLIRRVAAVEGKECGEDEAAWYRSTYGKEPDYSELLEMVAMAPAERMQLLRAYFEPNEEEKEAGKKIPTAAHHAIARLVADGYIRVIVTTNFDHLMERALDAAGVVPSVIASTDSILGATPLTHSGCTILKVHGDYLDPRLKNTAEEVGTYDDAMNRLLDQVFDEYGLIISGWSAEWDVALRAAIERCPNRRYMTYWSAYREVTGIAQQLCQSRSAQVVDGLSADDFFTKLAEKVEALKAMDPPHPLSARIAVASLKKYMAEDKDRIRLHDLVMGESNRVATALFSDLPTREQMPTLKQYESQLAILLPILAAAGYWGKPSHRNLWARAFQQLVTPRSGRFPGLAVEIDYYPAYLALYAFGISAMAGGRSGNLASLLAKTKTKLVNGMELPLIHGIIMHLKKEIIVAALRKEGSLCARMNVPISHYLQRQLREPLREWIPEDARYEELFDRFEYIVGLVLSEIYHKSMDRYVAVAGLYMANRDLPRIISEDIDKLKDSWPFLKAGLFDGSLDRLREVKDGFDQARSQVATQLGMC